MANQPKLIDAFPRKGSKTWALLNHLLQGTRVDTIFSITELNLATPNARVSELRKLGWPIRSEQVPHPRFTQERMVAYTLDAHFRDWYLKHHEHPLLYPFQDGRMKFADAHQEFLKTGDGKPGDTGKGTVKDIIV